MGSLNPIAAELVTLAERGGSGAVEVAGDPSGVMYFRGGQLTFATSPAVPDIAIRLIRQGYLAAGAWMELLVSAQPGENPADLLVSRGIIGGPELRALLRSTALDAVLALTLPFTAEPRVNARFLPRQGHWADSMLRMSVASVLDYADAMAARLARIPVAREGRPRLHALRRPRLVLDREQWAVVSRINGRSTVDALAWHNGAALHDTMACVGRLLESGACTLASAADEATGPAGAEGAGLGNTVSEASAPGSMMPGGLAARKPPPGGTASGRQAPARPVPGRQAERGTGPGPRPADAPAEAGTGAAEDSWPLLPRRVPGATTRTGRAVAPRPRPGRADFADFTASTAAAEASGPRQARPDIGLLQQVLRGLERLT